MQIGPRLRMLRQSMGVSLRALAEQTGFSVSFLSLVENDRASPSVASLERIAAGFGLSLAEFFQGAEELPCQVLRVSDRQAYASHWSQIVVEVLAQRSTGGALSPLLLRMAPGARSGKKPRAGLTEEFVLVLEGRVSLVLEDRVEELSAGDSLSLAAGTSRLWENQNDVPAVLLIVGHRFNSYIRNAGPVELTKRTHQAEEPPIQDEPS